MTSRTWLTRARTLGVGMVGVALGVTVFAAPPDAVAAEDVCAPGDLTVERWLDSRNNVALTTDAEEAAAAEAAGYSPTGEAFAAYSERPSSSWIWREAAPFVSTSASKNHTYLIWQSEIDTVTANRTYQASGSPFWVSLVEPECTTTLHVTRHNKGAIHTMAYTDDERQDNVAEGWSAGNYGWYAPATESAYGEADGGGGTEPGDGDGEFGLAMINDTQNEVFAWAGQRFANRTEWLADHADERDLRYIGHTGDIVNWWTEDESQYRIAAAAMDRLRATGRPVMVAVGNHDTMASGEGGSARDPKKTYQYQRDTTAFNRYFDYAEADPTFVAFEADKVDNGYLTFEAEGTRWMVVNLELWPRESVLRWTREQVAAHPDRNVIIQSHNLLNGACAIDGAGQDSTRWSYGDASPQRVWNQLVEPNPNVVMLSSGHTGSQCAKVLTTAGGHRVLGTLQNLSSTVQNHVRMFSVDVDKGQVITGVYSPENRVWVAPETSYPVDLVD